MPLKWFGELGRLIEWYLHAYSDGIIFGLIFLFFIYLSIFNWNSFNARPLQNMELQEKEEQKDWSIQEISLERTYS